MPAHIFLVDAFKHEFLAESVSLHKHEHVKQSEKERNFAGILTHA